MWGPSSSSLVKAQWAVHKFGGTSVADSACYQKVGNVLATTQTKDEVRRGTKQGAVVSAMTKITDALLKTMELARTGNEEYLKFFKDAVVERHFRTVRELLKAPEALLEVIRLDVENIEVLLKTIFLTKTLTLHFQELIVGHGEIWSAQILSAHLRELGKKSTWLDARKVLFVIPYSNPSQSPEVNWEVSQLKMDSWLQTQDPGLEVVVVTGYVASLADGTPTTLKRNGSDYSGSIFGALLRAFAITIWTDVDGVYSADPRKVPGAVLLDEMSYTEALEFSFYGAKIIHPKTMIPAVRAKIPVWIRNTFNHTCPGTKITYSISDDKKRSRSNLSSISSDEELRACSVIMGFCTIDNLSVIAIKAAAIGSKEYAPLVVREKLINSLHDLNVPLVLAAQAAPEHSIFYCVSSEFGDLALKKITEEFREEIQKGYIHSVKLKEGYSILTGVGEGISQTPGTAARFFTALHNAKVNVLGVAQNGERVICVLVESKNTSEGLRMLHTTFKLPSRSVSVALITSEPVKEVAPVLDAIHTPTTSLKDFKRVNVTSVLGADGMVLSNDVTSSVLQKAPPPVAPVDLSKFTQHLSNSLSQLKFVVDLSSNSSAVGFYERWIKSGFHIITTNRQSHQSSKLVLLAGNDLVNLRQEMAGRFNYELSLGSVASFGGFLKHLSLGDRITELEFSVSDAYSFVLNCLSNHGEGKEAPRFSAALAGAISQGLLAERESVSEISGSNALDEVKNLHFLLAGASPFKEGEIKLVPPYDGDLGDQAKVDTHFAKVVKEAAASGKVVRFTATLASSGACTISLKSFPKTHPFASLIKGEKLVMAKTKTSGTVTLRESACSSAKRLQKLVSLAHQVMHLAGHETPSTFSP